MSDPFLDAVADALAPIPRAYEMNAVPPKPIYPYLVYSVADDRPAGYTLDVSHGFRFRRVTWQSFGRNLTSTRATDAAATDCLLDRRLDVEGYDCGPCTADQGGLLGALLRDPDDSGVVGVTSSLTFTATKE